MDAYAASVRRQSYKSFKGRNVESAKTASSLPGRKSQRIGAEKPKRPQSEDRGLLNLSRRRPTFPRSYPRSIIGPARLNFRVRDGNGCDPRGMTTGNS